MATTCKLIAKNVLGSDTATVTFSSIPGTYDDLVLLVSARTTGNQAGVTLNFNGVTANLSSRWLYGSGSAAASSSSSSIFAFGIPWSATTADTFGNLAAYIPNYAGSTNKSVSIDGTTENNATESYIGAIAGLWADTSAITSATLTPQNGSFVTGSSFYLYGITKA